MSVIIVEVSVPEYTVKTMPDYLKIGRAVDKTIEQYFGNGKYIYRALSRDDHPGLTLDELVAIILKTGTDKYDPNRKGVCHEQFCVYEYDIQAGSFEIKGSKIVIEPGDSYPTLFGDTAHDFYENAPLDRGHPVRIDLLTLYNPHKLQPGKLRDPEAKPVAPNLEKYLYRFKDRENKKDALMGMVKILR